MPFCKQCKNHTQGALWSDTCRDCLRAFLGTDNEPITHRHASSRSSTTQMHHTQPVQPPAHFSNPFPKEHPSGPPAQPIPSHSNHAGENAFARHLARESRTGKSKEPSKNNKQATKTITCALMLYRDGTCVQPKGLVHTQQLVNLSDPNLYDSLRAKLWTIFEDEINKHIGNDPLPGNPLMHTFLSQREAKIPDQATLSHIIQEAGTRKKIAFDLMYHHPDDLGSSPATSPRMKSQVNPLKRPYQKTATNSQKRQNTSSTKMATAPKATTKSWAVRGPSASKPVHRSMDMVSRLGQLSKNISRSSLVPLSEWITGNRLDFFTSTSQPDTIPPSTRFQLANGIQGNTHPICYRINLNEKLGEGSMRKAYATEVKTDLGGGIEHINHWVAKVRKSDNQPSIGKHATDALMYQAFGHLLERYKEILMHCPSLNNHFKLKAQQISVSLQKTGLHHGNTSSEGIQSFLKMHCCHPGNQVCEALGLGRVVDLEWVKPTPSFDHLLASRNNGVPDGSDFTSINEPQHQS
ncbi:hypothetical protein MJO28_010714 [Puccinia striiformis f. sp. tritici]|uniref:Uncharacterized protein n=1 Tax=Puccinia striiformis f. sp. tritici TaxID=168172 RepID=A0ACC0E7C9_9BASI|nr:hypothetical protein MJO28_010714 [Puccinia striiformis f. sp. tritici]